MNDTFHQKPKVPRGRMCLNGLQFPRSQSCGSTRTDQNALRLLAGLFTFMSQKLQQKCTVDSRRRRCLDTRMLLEMFYNFVKTISRVEFGQRSIQDVPLSRADVSLHNTAAFRRLLLFRLHVDSHRALTYFQTLAEESVAFFRSRKQSERHTLKASPGHCV